MKTSWHIGAVSWKLRNLTSDRGFFAHLEELLLKAKELGAEVVLLPENINYEFLTLHESYRDEDIPEILYPYSEAVELELKRYSKESGMIIIGGTHYFQEKDGIFNSAIVTHPKQKPLRVAKNRLTEYEKIPLSLKSGKKLTKLTPYEIGLLICYDSEFPEAAGLLADSGMQILCVPYFTDGAQGYHRIRYSGLARAVELQSYVVHAGLVGTLNSNACEHAIGRASFFAPPIGDFPDDGVLKEGALGEEEVVVLELSLDRLMKAREGAAVKNSEDRIKKFNMEEG